MLGRGSLGGGYLLSPFRSTIGVVRLNFSVRNGKRWNPHAITTFVSFQTPNQWRCDGVNPSTGTRTQTDCAATGADAARFRRLLTIDSHERTRAVSRQRCFAFGCSPAPTGFPAGEARDKKAFGSLVRLGSTCRHACTCRLSTSSSATTLMEILSCGWLRA